MIIVGLDGGNFKVKLFGDAGELSFESNLGEYRERKLEQVFSEDDMIFEYKERKGFAGTLAKFESEFSTSMMGDTKAHEDFLIRVLIALYRYSECNDYKIVVGQPISRHTANEKKKIKTMLEGTHDFKLNGIERAITIHQCEVAAEGGAAFWSHPKGGLIRLLDIGSGTINAATLNEGRYIDKDSFTLKFGMETRLTEDNFSTARAIAVHALKKWNNEDQVFLVGGGAATLLEPLREYFPNVSILKPAIKTREADNKITLKHIDTTFANAVGFYNIAKKLYKVEKKVEVFANEE